MFPWDNACTAFLLFGMAPQNNLHVPRDCTMYQGIRIKCAIEPAVVCVALMASKGVQWYKPQNIRIFDEGNTLQLICSCFAQHEAIIAPCKRCHEAQSQIIICVKGSTAPLTHVEPLVGMCALWDIPSFWHPEIQTKAHNVRSCERTFCSPSCLF